STTMRIPTSDGTVWFKASGPGTAHEGRLLEIFRTRGIRQVLLPLAVHPERPWLLFEDGGPTLRATRADGTGDHDLLAWQRILTEYAALQRSLESATAVEVMLAAGVPDGRPERLAAELERLLEDDTVWARVSSEEVVPAAAARRRLAGSRGAAREAARRLASAGVAATVQHDDLHGGNIFTGPTGDRIFDWGDASVAHPFATLTATFNSIADKTGLALDDPAFSRLRDTYTDAWTDVLPQNALAELTELARDFGCLGEALAWERALIGLEPAEMDGLGDSVAGWLIEFADRFNGRA
ncbi:MAG TPA: phosphotransferase, partial [Candidatus Limnocylindrales bacterium]